MKGKYDRSRRAILVEMVGLSWITIHILFIDKRGHALVRKPKKIFMGNTNIIYAICGELGKSPDLGALRETFLVNQLRCAGHKVFYSEVGDLVVGDRILEVGGPSKGNEQIKGVKDAYRLKDEILDGVGNEIPLWAMGLLY